MGLATARQDSYDASVKPSENRPVDRTPMNQTEANAKTAKRGTGQLSTCLEGLSTWNDSPGSGERRVTGVLPSVSHP
jgi:hypothetical protein